MYLPKGSCLNRVMCYNCVKKRHVTDCLPYRFFSCNGGDKSNENHYRVLKKRFEGEDKSST